MRLRRLRDARVFGRLGSGNILLHVGGAEVELRGGTRRIDCRGPFEGGNGRRVAGRLKLLDSAVDPPGKVDRVLSRQSGNHQQQGKHAHKQNLPSD